MKFYILNSWENAYASFVPQKKDHDMFEYLKHLPALENYTPIEMVRHDCPKPRRQGGDLVNTEPPIVSQRFKDTMGEILTGKGVFYPVITDGEAQNYWIFKIENCIDAIDFDRSTGAINRWQPENKFSTLHSFFMQENLNLEVDPIIFSTPQFPYNFVTDGFVEKVKLNKLTGIYLYKEGDVREYKNRIFLNKNIK